MSLKLPQTLDHRDKLGDLCPVVYEVGEAVVDLAKGITCLCDYPQCYHTSEK